MGGQSSSIAAVPARGSHLGNEPLVVGVIGPSGRKQIRRLGRSRRSDHQIVQPDLAVFSSSGLPTWRSETGEGLYWHILDRSVSPSNEIEAIEEAGCAGLIIGGDTLTLHSDPLSVSPVYYVQVQGHVYFSNRLQPMLDLVRSPSLDPMAWGSLAATRCMPPGRSPVTEVATLPPGQMLEFDRTNGRVAMKNRPWIDPVPGSSADLIEEVQRVLAAATPYTQTLSGGYDSRFLLACGVAAGLELDCLTADPDVGGRTDVEIAGQVAGAVGVQWTEAPRLDSWLEAFEQSTSRLDYRTTFHPWFMPASVHARTAQRAVAFGLGGGVTLNDHLQIRGERVDFEESRLRLVRSLGIGRLDPSNGYSPGLTGLKDRLEKELVGWTDSFHASPAWQALTVLTLRTAPSISGIATRLTGPEVPVSMPHLTSRVLRLTLDPRMYERRGNGAYVELIRATGVGIADIPTTRDLHSSDAVATRVPAQSGRRTLRKLASLIAGSEPARCLLSANVRTLLTNPGGLASGYAQHQTVLHGAAALALFLTEYPQVDATSLLEAVASS